VQGDSVPLTRPGRAGQGPRHAAPRRSLLSRMRKPAGKAMALAAMPTAVLMGMSITPRPALAEDKAFPFAPGPCVTRPQGPVGPDEPEDGGKLAGPAPQPDAVPGPAAPGTGGPEEPDRAEGDADTEDDREDDREDTEDDREDTEDDREDTEDDRGRVVRKVLPERSRGPYPLGTGRVVSGRTPGSGTRRPRWASGTRCRTPSAPRSAAGTGHRAAERRPGRTAGLWTGRPVRALPGRPGPP
jgi:hypothetical protein